VACCCRLPARIAGCAARFGDGAAAAGGITITAPGGIKPSDSSARLQAWPSCGGGKSRAARTLCSSGPVHEFEIGGCVDAMCCKMMDVLKVLPSRAASTKSFRVENRRSFEFWDVHEGLLRQTGIIESTLSISNRNSLTTPREKRRRS
jgi:hypothetical protein